jgi:ApaG protein
MQVITVWAYTSKWVKVFRSAWIPAPPELSDPAMVTATGVSIEGDFSFKMAHYNRVGSVFRELTNLRVLIDKVVYMPTLEAPPDRPYPFVYFITIDNQSSETVTIRGRKWVITDQLGQKIVVEGDGVVGEFPRLRPGERFSYQSYHVIGTDSVAEGAFIGISDQSVPFVARIPRFQMQVPKS